MCLAKRGGTEARRPDLACGRMQEPLFIHKGGNTMEIIKPGTRDVHEMAILTCCWPPLTRKSDSPEE